MCSTSDMKLEGCPKGLQVSPWWEHIVSGILLQWIHRLFCVSQHDKFADFSKCIGS